MKLQDIFRTRLAGLSIGRWLSLFVAMTVANTILDYYRAQNTNHEYLKSLIESHTLERAVTEFVAVARKGEGGESLTGVEWKEIEQGLSACLVREANKYLESGDPYLRKRADKATPQVLAQRFWKQCGVWIDAPPTHRVRGRF